VKSKRLHLIICLCLLPLSLVFEAWAGKPVLGGESRAWHSADSAGLAAAFVRSGDLWIKIGEEERRLTEGEQVREPKWSRDGRWIAYTSGQRTLRLFSLDSGTSLTVSENATNVQWSPVNNKLAFQSDAILHVADADRWEDGQAVTNAAKGVGNYSWLPNGRGFLVSTQAQPLPSGWSDIRLYEIPLAAGKEFPQGRLLLTIPSEQQSFFAIQTGRFHWSEDYTWVAFLAIPTASLSADGDTLLIMSWNGKKLIPAGEMLNREEWLAWSPQAELLAFIGGTGRDATIGKKLTVARAPFSHKTVLTPDGFADRDLAWLPGGNIVVSRAQENKGNSGVPFAEPVQPSLVKVSAADHSAVPISAPPPGFGDYRPEYDYRSQLMSWIRSNGSDASVWIGGTDGAGAREWISGLDHAPVYYGQMNWDEVLDLYHPKKQRQPNLK
jgi:hypothetical protein